MNISNSSLSPLIVYDSVYIVGQLFGYFVIPITALIGTILRIIFAATLLYSKLMKYPKYMILFYKMMNVTFYNVIFIGYQNNRCYYCPDRFYNTYSSQFYQLFVLHHLIDLIKFQINFFEILITYDRFCVLRKTKSVLFKFNIKYLSLICLLIALFINLPDYFAFKLVYWPLLDKYSIVKTNFGNSYVYFFYHTFEDFSIRIFTIISIILLNILNIIEYKQFIKSKLKVIRNIKKIRAETVFTRMVIMGTCLFSFGLINIGWSYGIIQIDYLNGILYNSFANLSLAVSEEIMLLAFISDIFIFFSMDTNFKRIFKTFSNKIKSVNQSTKVTSAITY